MQIKAQIESIREASAAFDSLHDVEIARQAAYAQLAQFEGLRRLAPDSEDALFLLTRGWAETTAAFTEEDLEVAEDLRNKDLADYHRQRAMAGYQRAILYGLDLIAHRAEGFAEARRNDASLRAWLKEHFTRPEDAPNLLWLGCAWLSRTNLTREDTDLMADLWVGVALVERSIDLDPRGAHGQGLTLLAAYHARSAQAELDEARSLFQNAFDITSNRSLMQKFHYATRYLCARADKVAYARALREIVDAGDIFPEQRLGNAIAKKRARRYLGKARMEEMRVNCGFSG
jgi:hypothetical protein